jgi:group I intron endonuclease
MKNSIILFNQKNPSENNLINNIVSVIVYSNAETCKDQILKDNLGKVGVYQWKHNDSGKIYIGSAVDLSKRFRNYFAKKYLNRFKSMYIYNALLCHGYSAFSLDIVEYIDISNLSKEDARLLILKREQFYIDELKPGYNINPTAGSRLGSFHTLDTKEKISGVQSAENNSMYGKSHSAEAKAKMSEAKSGENNPFFGKSHSAESLALMSLAKSKMVYVYSFNSETKETILFKYFNSCSDAANFFDSTTRTISNYLDKKKFYKKKWVLSSIELQKLEI